MAVQKSRKSRSRRDMRRSHDFLTSSCVSIDPITGEKHRRHHIASDGYYKGKQVIFTEKAEQTEEKKITAEFTDTIFRNDLISD